MACKQKGARGNMYLKFSIFDICMLTVRLNLFYDIICNTHIYTHVYIYIKFIYNLYHKNIHIHIMKFDSIETTRTLLRNSLQTENVLATSWLYLFHRSILFSYTKNKN